MTTQRETTLPDVLPQIGLIEIILKEGSHAKRVTKSKATRKGAK